MLHDTDCTSCRSLDPNNCKGGKYLCTSHREFISARTLAVHCPDFKEVMGRCACDKEAMRKNSKNHGYYVMTAISSVLGLPEDNQYMILFKKLRDEIMSSSLDTTIPDVEEEDKEASYAILINRYEEAGPTIAEAIQNNPNAYEICKYYEQVFLKDFVKFMLQEKYTEAAILYFNFVIPGIKNALTKEYVAEKNEDQTIEPVEEEIEVLETPDFVNEESVEVVTESTRK